MFEWYFRTHNLSRSSTFIINSVDPQQGGQYKCTVTSLYSNLSTDAFATLHVRGTYNHVHLYLYIASYCFIEPSFDSQTKLEQISSSALANTITVSIPQIDNSGYPIRYIH